MDFFIVVLLLVNFHMFITIIIFLWYFFFISFIKIIFHVGYLLAWDLILLICYDSLLLSTVSIINLFLILILQHFEEVIDYFFTHFVLSPLFYCTYLLYLSFFPFLAESPSFYVFSYMELSYGSWAIIYIAMCFQHVYENGRLFFIHNIQ